MSIMQHISPGLRQLWKEISQPPCPLPNFKYPLTGAGFAPLSDLIHQLVAQSRYTMVQVVEKVGR
jgi:hypothetical protein